GDVVLAEHAELLLLLLLPALLLFLPPWLASFLRHLDRRLLLRPTDADGDVAAPLGLGRSSLLLHLGRGPLQARPDLLGFDLDLGALFALGGLPRVGPKAPHDHHAASLGQGLRHVLRELAPRRHVEERRLRVLPLARGLVLEPAA